MNVVKKAKDLAKLVHSGQVRKDGRPYFNHVQAVADIVCNNWLRLIPYSGQEQWGKVKDHVVAAAFLHNTVEDTYLNIEELNRHNFSQLTIELIYILTKRPSQTYIDYIHYINNCGAYTVVAKDIKIADLEHNMSDLKECHQKDKYRLAHYILSYGLVIKH